MSRCRVCWRAGHNSRAHNGLSSKELAALKADGQEFMARGFREVGEMKDGGDLLDQLRADTEAASIEGPKPDTPPVDLPDPLPADASVEVWQELVIGGADPVVPQPDDVAPITFVGEQGPELTTPEEVADLSQRIADYGEQIAAAYRVPPALLEPVRDRDVCTACLAEMEYGPTPLMPSGGRWRHTVHPDDDHDVEVRWDPQAPPLIVAPWLSTLADRLPIRITEPGVYQLTAQEYHDPAVTGEWMSNSDGKKLIGKGCPAQFRYDRDHGVRGASEAFNFGHLVHAIVLGKGDEIAVRPATNPEDPDDVWDSWRKNSAKAWRARHEKAGHIVVLPEEMTRAEEMADAVWADDEGGRLLRQPGRPEVALFWWDAEAGVKRRALVDWLPDAPGPDGVFRPVDFKTAEDVAPDDDMDRAIWRFGYNRQAVTIADGCVALGLADVVDVAFVMQAKSAPYIVTVVTLDSVAERIGRIDNRQAMDVWLLCTGTGVWPNFTNGKQVVRSVPAYIANRYDEDIEMS